MEKELILMVGPIGSGKTTFAKTLENDNSIRISQDEQGKKGHLNIFTKSLEETIPRIIIDRMGFNGQQRDRYIDLARKYGYSVSVFELDTPRDVCIQRCMERKKHPTVQNDEQLINKILDFYYSSYEKVDEKSIDNYNLVEYED